jgi:F-type H+-transporting ATPase subunit gamma
MSHLIHIKQKIKTVETISKVTHAMRLIAMSSHSQLKHNLSNVIEYTNNLCRLFQQTRRDHSSWNHPLLVEQDNDKQLFIIIGSQKGLCGSFTNVIAHKAIAAYKSIGNQTIITVGRQINSFLSTNYGTVSVLSFNQFNSDNYATIAESIINYIWNNETKFHRITIISMKSKGFFMQVPIINELMKDFFFIKSTQQNFEYYYEKDTQSTLNSLFKQALVASLMNHLYESLIAEQAARFLSMDNSTRNAKKILEATKLYYNKLRQTKITTQLMELISVCEHH